MERIKSEQKTVEAMIRLYCRKMHGTSAQMCDECNELCAYARMRLSRCLYGNHKPVCARCPVHCYRPDMREKIRQVMRFSGPGMLLHKPILSLAHLFRSLFSHVK